jgi:hypothetical protein
MHTESWCCDRSSLELSAESNVLLLLFFNNVECLPCSSCYIYICNASQNLSIFRSHRGRFDIEIRIFHLSWENFFCSAVSLKSAAAAAVAASAAGEDF